MVLFIFFMAKIYGFVGSEKGILNYYSDYVKKFEDIDIIYKDLNNRLKKKEQKFLDNLPNKIKKEKKKLENIRNKKRAIIYKCDRDIKKIKNKIKIYKHNKKWFSILLGLFQIIIKKYFLKFFKLIKNRISEINQEKILFNWENNFKDIFNENNSDLIKKIEVFKKIKNDPYYPGALGELEVLNELSKLNDEYIILCGLNIELDSWVSYGDENYNLKSAQMDFVVISYKGIFLIEVKNWSNNYYCNQIRDFSPHEQVDRAGRVLYLFLKSKLKSDIVIQRKIKKILLPINNNIPYNPKYKSVFISNLRKINNFIIYSPDVFSKSDIKEIVKVLK